MPNRYAHMTPAMIKTLNNKAKTLTIFLGCLITNPPRYDFITLLLYYFFAKNYNFVNVYFKTIKLLMFEMNYNSGVYERFTKKITSYFKRVCESV